MLYITDSSTRKIEQDISGRLASFFEPRHCNGLAEKIDGNPRTRSQNPSLLSANGNSEKNVIFDILSTTTTKLLRMSG